MFCMCLATTLRIFNLEQYKHKVYRIQVVASCIDLQADAT